MTWRWQPPVSSPVSSRALVSGIGAAIGFRSVHEKTLVEGICRRYSATDALLTNSGTSALILTLRKLLPPGGTVAFPGYGCIDLTSAALGAGVKVRLYDVDPSTLSPDLDSVRTALSRGVDAIVVTHLYGYPADIHGVQVIARPYGIPVIEDAAQGAGGTLLGHLLGTLGEVAILSFGRGKGMTSGSGGALLVRRPELAAWTQRIYTELGAASGGGLELMALAAQSLLTHPSMYRLPASIPALKLGAMVYRAPTEPRPMAAAAKAVLGAALRMDEHEVKRRRARASDLLTRITGSNGIVAVRPVPGGESGYLRLALLDTGGHCVPRATIGALRGYPMTLEQHPQLQSLLHHGERAGKGSEILRDTLFTLPTHPHVNGSDLTRLEKWLA
jgi:perosamine synthetase